MAYLIVFFTLICTHIFCWSPPSKPADWDNWKFNQKIKWRGLNLDPRIPYGPLVDKIKVKQIVQKDIKVAQILFATDDPSEISMEKLPKTFIMKANNGCGRGILVKDGVVLGTKKQESNFSPIKCTDRYLRAYAKKWLSDLRELDQEKQYALVEPIIFFEEYLEDIKLEVELYFFNGKVRLITVYFMDGYTNAREVSFYNENWEKFDINHPRHRNRKTPIEKPFYIDDLIAFGERYAEKIDHVRIDFFINGDNVYFGEFTFTTSGGNGIDHLNAMIGTHWDFPDPTDPLFNPLTDCQGHFN
jgi:hypothetical protein